MSAEMPSTYFDRLSVSDAGMLAIEDLDARLFSYQKGLFRGFNADWDSIPDLHDRVEAIDSGFELLRKAAASAPASSRGGTRNAARERSAKKKGGI